MTHPQYLDTLGVWDATVGLPEQLRAAAATAEAAIDRRSWGRLETR